MNYAPFRQSAPTFLAIGAIVGLVLGLLIGWVFWPVEWVGATLRDLDTQAKAEYIAAVADAFVIYDSPEAAEVAQRRLALLDDGNLDQTLNTALQYFNESQFSDRAIRDSNIRRLAVALNLSSVGGAGPSQALPVASADVVATPTTAALTTSLPAAESAGRLGWVGWLLWLLTALILVVGGIFLLSRAGLPDLSALLKLRSPAPSQSPTEIDEYEDASLYQRRPQAATRGASGPAVDYSFEQEEEDWQAPNAPTESYARRITPTVYAAEDDLADDFAEDDFTDDDFADDDFARSDDPNSIVAREPFDDEDNGAATWRSPGRSYTIDVPQDNFIHDHDSPATPSPYAPPSTGTRSQGPVVDSGTGASTEEEQPRAAWAPPAARRSDTGRAEIKSSERAPVAVRTRAKVIDQHSFQYRIGIAEYDESRPIVDPQSGKYIGEFGMGASSKNGLAQIAPDQLVALEVWLFDKSDERNLGNQTRILLSEYAIDHNLEQAFLRERQDNPRPFTAQPGIHFQLESQNLLLDCTIVDVEYSTASATKGIFQAIKVDMTIQQKK